MEMSLGGRYLVSRQGYGRAIFEHPDLLANVVFFNHWQRRRNPFKTLAEGDTLYLWDPDVRRLVVELRVAALVASSYKTRLDGMQQLRAVFGIAEPEDGWPGYDPAPGPGYLLAYTMDVVNDLDIGFDFRWDVLGGHNGYVSLDTFSASTRINSAERDRVVEALPAPGGPSRVKADPVDTRVLITDEALAMPPRRASVAVMAAVAERSGYICERPACDAPAAHFDHHVPWSKGGNSDLPNMFHLCAACNLSKSDSMPSNYEPEQLWFQHYSYDIEGESITISENATALEVATANSIYDVVFDDDVMLTVKRGQRTVNCAYTSDVSGIHDINGRGRCLVIGVEPSGEAADAAWSFRTSPVQNERTTPAAVAMTTLGVTPGRPVTFAN